jgi:hypothetical protein
MMEIIITHERVKATLSLDEEEIGFLRTIAGTYSDKFSSGGFIRELLEKLDAIHTPNYNRKFPAGRCR